MTGTRVAVPPQVGDAAGLERLVAVLDGATDGCRYIGGWVRDTLLGDTPQDIDVATRLPPEEAQRRAKQVDLQVWSSASGRAHGTIGVVIGGKSIEVTTLRRDVATDGRHAKVAFTDDWREDSARRDFTINALSADPLTGEVHDYFGGLADLKAGCVRFIGDPETRIAEDHLRILRFFRFHARFGRGEPHAASYAACVARARDLMALSRERIAVELLKLLAVPDPVPAVRAMLGGGLFAPVLPEIADDGCLAALIAAERAADIAPDGLRRLAALLPPDPVVVDRVAARLRLSKTDRRRLAFDADRSISSAEALVYGIGTTAAVDRLLLAGKPEEARRGADWQAPHLPIGGGALIAKGLEPGPAVAATLRQIEAGWIEKGFPMGEAFDRLVTDAVAQALRERQ